ncbi:MAG TPA: radical SAM family heme chaperone HemW [Burkholderiaceae bacterium]|nr:radical SAM family heme chaperone HemW [Burkholderiaceae bacterium]
MSDSSSRRIPIAVAQNIRVQRPGEIRFTALPPLSLYVHVPWCVRKCPYCDFNSHEFSSSTEHVLPDENRYLDALRADLEYVLPSVWGRRVHTIFIGGGTPSLLSARGLDRLLADIRARLPIDADAEITLEANPGTFEVERFAQYRASGINRLSIGIQSFDDACLKRLGRIHGRDEALRATEIAATLFDNFNLDVMYALPGQSLQACEDDLRTALSFKPPHLSVYQLTLEANTVFAKYPPELPNDDLSAHMQETVEAMTADAGMRHYEVSAYAQPGRSSRHNLNYWTFGDYIGIGAGAHGKISFPDRIVREVRYKQPASYMEACERGESVVERSEIAADELGFEFMLNALRLRDGVAAHVFEERTGVSLSRIHREIQVATQKGLLAPDPTRLQPTALGRRFLNDLQALFLRD